MTERMRSQMEAFGFRFLQKIKGVTGGATRAHAAQGMGLKTAAPILPKNCLTLRNESMTVFELAVHHKTKLFNIKDILF